MELSAAVCIPCGKAQALRTQLEKLHIWDQTRRLHKVDDQNVAIPVKCAEGDLFAVLQAWPESKICYQALPPSKHSLFQAPYDRLKAAISKLLQGRGFSESLLTELPQKWERHGDLLLIPPNAFTCPQWLQLGQDLWTTVAQSLSCNRIAVHSPIADNGFRSSQVKLMLGNDGRVVHTDNGIQYSYDVTKCMFSAGNVTEKLRVAQFNCKGEVVVDLYSGIGYFTLPYLVHAKAEHIHACEWNPNAIAALKENLKLNGVVERCTIHEGDNRKLDLEEVADRVNLGLIPTSNEGWPVAVKALKRCGGFLHVHGNVTTRLTASASWNHNGDSSVSLTHRYASGSRDNSVGPCDCNNISTPNITALPTPCPYKSTSIKDDLLSDQSRLIGKKSTDCENDNILGNKCHDCLSNSEFSNRNDSHTEEVKCVFNSNSAVVSPAATQWAFQVASCILGLLQDTKGGQWTVQILHIEKVKSYAPHIDHMVVDLEVRPEL